MTETPPARSVKARGRLVWLGIALLITVPIVAAAASPLLAWRGPIYIFAGFAGVVALALIFLQPMLISGGLPGVGGRRSRQWHRLVGIALTLAVLLHVAGLWITSPPDAIDALLLVSPTPFSPWGVVAMWALLASAGLAAFARKTRLWRLGHRVLAVIIVVGGVVHALLVEGTMEPISKTVLCLAVLCATGAVLMRAPLRRWLVAR